MIIFKDFRFEAAHFLPNVPENHKCKRMHGHSYKVRVYVKGKQGVESGWVLDFAELKSIIHSAVELLDHHILNEIAGLENPTAENLAIWIWNKIKGQLPGLYEVHVNETEESGCIYSGT
jgi:6-pyruvoyltetrahydropterin/6-carboxytetrahydropterin synthase